MYYVYIYIGTHSAPFCSRCGKAVKCQDQRCITVWSVFGSAFCKQLQILQTSGPLSLARLYTRALHRTKLSWHTPTFSTSNHEGQKEDGALTPNLSAP